LEDLIVPKEVKNEVASLTPPERETVIIFSDADDFANIHTYQRTIITKLKNNPAALLLREGKVGTTAWGEFELPKALISFRQGSRKGTRKGGNTEALAKARAAKAK
jgi:hypothetical protein